MFRGCGIDAMQPKHHHAPLALTDGVTRRMKNNKQLLRARVWLSICQVF